jgi:bifunctional DNA-binding transcriptional regulator/antitoxin component of YhaV-PrlF toxin-antitoxin module
MRKRAVTPTHLPGPVASEARLRSRYQLTLPEPIALALAARPDDRLVFEADPAEPGVVRVRKARATWAGAAAGAFGSEDEVLAYLREERSSWGA